MKVISIIVALFISGLCAVRGCSEYYKYDSRIDAILNRAQVSADREDMVKYMTELKTNMEELDMTSGHFAVFWKTPDNDLALHYQTVIRVLERLEAIKDIPMKDTAYQVALDDIRGTIRELPNPGSAICWTRNWWLLLIGLAVWAFPVLIFLREDW